MLLPWWSGGRLGHQPTLPRVVKEWQICLLQRHGVLGLALWNAGRAEHKCAQNTCAGRFIM